MPESISITVNGSEFAVRPGVSLAAALVELAFFEFRNSCTGEPRGPVCGIGICFECRVTVDNEPHVRSCQVVCRNGMIVESR
jgi:aerobic-type carbon monoxide dehydrogenase small subunit (CoxS/CutS family)